MATPEEQARQIIDAKLGAAGWKVQDKSELDLSAGLGVAVREVSLARGHGETDYLLYVDRKAIGVVEAKPLGHTLSGVEEQAARYADGVPKGVPAWHRPLPFRYESTGEETHFTNDLDPEPRSRDIFHFHRPETLLTWVQAKSQLRGRLCDMPPLMEKGLWPAQIRAIKNLERSLSLNRPRALIQMATGAGKTFTAANFTYRLIKHADAQRVLFLVDRRNLGEQTIREFSQFQPADDSRRFSDLYNIQLLRSNSINKASRVVVTTVQRLYSMLRGEQECDPEAEEGSMFESARPFFTEPPPVEYSPALPIETFDFIVVDECHRSIYNLWRQVIEYFDAFIVGLTATPSKQTIGFFRRNLVMEYTHPEAVADGVNVDYDVFRIRTKISEGGSTVEAGNYVDKRDRATRRVRYEQLDDDLTYTANQLDRDIVAVDQIRTVVRTFRDKLPEIFPGRTEVPKTLIFAKDDSHAEDIVNVMREEFGKGNEFCEKITYRTGFLRVAKKVKEEDGSEREVVTYEKVSNLTPEDVLANFRNSFNPRIAVTVDLVATGTDVKPLEIVMFMRNVKSANFFEQMKGRAVRVICEDELQAVTPDARAKSRFVIIDCVGVCEQDKTDSVTLNRQPSASFEKLLNHVAMGGTDPDVLSTLAARLARMDREIASEEREELAKLAGGKSLSQVAGDLVHAVDPDAQEAEAGEEPTEEETKAAVEKLAAKAVEPLLKPKYRNRLIEIKKHSEQTVDKVSLDEVLGSGFDAQALEKAKGKIESFRQWIEENRDEILALQLLYSGRYANRLKFEDVKELASRISRPPLSTTPSELWRAYEALEKSRARGGGGKQLVDLVSLVRHAIRPDDPLVPFQYAVMQRYEKWIKDQERAGAEFTADQRQWLDKIAEHIATSLRFETEDFSIGWFSTHGDLGKAHELFGDRLNRILAELNEKLVA